MRTPHTTNPARFRVRALGQVPDVVSRSNPGRTGTGSLRAWRLLARRRTAADCPPDAFSKASEFQSARRMPDRDDSEKPTSRLIKSAGGCAGSAVRVAHHDSEYDDYTAESITRAKGVMGSNLNSELNFR